MVSPKILVCNNPEPATSSKARWDNTTWDGSRWLGDPAPVRLTITGPDWAKESILWACREWEKVCAIEFTWVDNQAEAWIFITQGRIDGPSSTLAWHQLPYGPDQPLEGRLDTSEKWHLDPNTNPGRGEIHLGAVLCHELGHGIGLEHIPTTAGRALLNPMYGADVLTPQDLDIEQVVYRYGPPLATPTPNPTPDNGDEPPGQIVIELPDLAAGRYRLVKL